MSLSTGIAGVAAGIKTAIASNVATVAVVGTLAVGGGVVGTAAVVNAANSNANNTTTNTETAAIEQVEDSGIEVAYAETPTTETVILENEETGETTEAEIDTAKLLGKFGNADGSTTAIAGVDYDKAVEAVVQNKDSGHVEDYTTEGCQHSWQAHNITYEDVYKWVLVPEQSHVEVINEGGFTCKGCGAHFTMDQEAEANAHIDSAMAQVKAYANENGLGTIDVLKSGKFPCAAGFDISERVVKVVVDSEAYWAYQKTGDVQGIADYYYCEFCGITEDEWENSAEYQATRE